MDQQVKSHQLRAVIYNRIAHSASRQRLSEFGNFCREYALKKGFVVVEELSDVASGATLNRKGLTRVRELVSSGQVDAVIIYDFARLTRMAPHAILLQSEFKRFNVRLICAAKDLDISHANF